MEKTFIRDLGGVWIAAFTGVFANVLTPLNILNASITLAVLIGTLVFTWVKVAIVWRAWKRNDAKRDSEAVSE